MSSIHHPSLKKLVKNCAMVCAHPTWYRPFVSLLSSFTTTLRMLKCATWMRRSTLKIINHTPSLRRHSKVSYSCLRSRCKALSLSARRSRRLLSRGLPSQKRCTTVKCEQGHRLTRYDEKARKWNETGLIKLSSVTSCRKKLSSE